MIVTFSDDEIGQAPAWIASVMAIKDDVDTLINHAVVLIAADTEHQAHDKALNMALRTWRLADGWDQHHAVVDHLESSLNVWLNLPQSTRWTTAHP